MRFIRRNKIGIITCVALVILGLVIISRTEIRTIEEVQAIAQAATGEKLGEAMALEVLSEGESLIADEISETDGIDMGEVSDNTQTQFQEDADRAGTSLYEISETRQSTGATDGSQGTFTNDSSSANLQDIEIVSEETVASTYADGKDKYLTDPIPEGRQEPINIEDQSVDEQNSFYVTLSIDCYSILENMDDLKQGLESFVGDGQILATEQVLCYKGESVWQVLLRECQSRGINVEYRYTPIYGTVYVEGINNLCEFDCGELSGWCYAVNGWYPNYGASRYILKEGDEVQWRYTCDLGLDIGNVFE